jgi:CDP-diacylglycerol--glycerol-3-phosphate 3-phosphatidyltransferase
VLTAHPHANGFYGSKGVSGLLPGAYTHLAKSFLRKVKHEGLADSIILKEWKKGMVGQEGGWTYHAKGLWVTFPSSSSSEVEKEDPSLTVIGSSNYTKRSYELDLEANVVIATSDPGLRRRLGEEVKWLGEHANQVNEQEFEKPERKVGMNVRMAMWAVRVLGGAL